MKRTYSHIDMDERRKIARWRTAGLSVELIAEKLGRHRSMIIREIRRNTFTDAGIVDLNAHKHPRTLATVLIYPRSRRSR